ncbi:MULTISPECIES: hypothetical protein [Pontibacter]|nr:MULTISPECIES: hypothetical protein [Pontibacter]
MEIIIIASVLALYAVGYFVYYMYGRDRKKKRRKKFYDHFWP